MKGLKIIPVFAVFLILSYIGTLFVKANFLEVSVNLGAFKTPPAPLGLVVLTSVLIGMIVVGAICSLELIYLSFSNKKLRKRLNFIEKESEQLKADVEDFDTNDSLTLIDEKDEKKEEPIKNGTTEY